jgi:hypothetical protein
MATSVRNVRYLPTIMRRTDLGSPASHAPPDKAQPRSSQEDDMVMFNEAATSWTYRRSVRDATVLEARVMRERASLARTIDLLLRETAEPIRLRSRRRIADRDVVSGCTASLREIATTLRDASQPIDALTVASIHWFLRDTASSPLFADHPIAARFAAEALRCEITTG